LGVAFIYREKFEKHRKIISNQFSHHKIFLERVVVLFQTLYSFEEVYRTDESGGYPTNYAAFVNNAVFQVFSLDFIGGASCVMDYNFYDELLGKTLAPTVALLFIVLKIQFSGRNKMLETIAYYICTLTLVPVSTIVFRTFACSTYQFEFDDVIDQFVTEKRLRADLTINCDSSTHQAYMTYAIFMMLLYPVGVPLAAIVLLHRNKAAITDFLRKYERAFLDTLNATTRFDPPDSIERFKSLYAYFRPEYSWWGVYEILNRLILTGFAVFFIPGSAMQIVLALLFSVVYFAAQILLQPYRDSYHNFVTALVNVQITVTLFASLLIKIDNEAGDDGSYEAGYDLQTVGVVLVLWNSIVLVEILRYVKSAFEFAFSVVVIQTEQHVVGSEDQDEFEGQNAQNIWLSWLGDQKKLAECVRQLRDLRASLNNEKIRDKVQSENKNALTKKIREAGEILSDGPLSMRKGTWWSSSTSATYDPSQLNKMQKELDTIATSINAKTSPSGFYFPVDKNLKSFPHESIFWQLFELCSGDGVNEGKGDVTGSEERSLLWNIIWWRKDVYVNDDSGWILRRTLRGWEIVPFMSWGKFPQFESEVGLTSLYPPSSGWKRCEPGGAAELHVWLPFLSLCQTSASSQNCRRAGTDIQQRNSFSSDEGLAIFDQVQPTKWQVYLANRQFQALEQIVSTSENIAMTTIQRLEGETQRLESDNCELMCSKERLLSAQAEFENEANLASKHAQHLRRENHLMLCAKFGFKDEVKAQMQKFTGETSKLAAEANLQVQMLTKEREGILFEIAALKSEKFQRAQK